MSATVFNRSRLLTAVVAGATLVLFVSHPTLAKSLGADVWNVPALNEELRASANESKHLDSEDEEIQNRIAVKEAIIEELLTGRATLAEVTEKFTELNVTRPAYMDAIRASYTGTTDREKMARNVISYALARCPVDARDTLAQKFDAELEQMIAPDGAH